jgi:glutaredoxin-related protein
VRESFIARLIQWPTDTTVNVDDADTVKALLMRLTGHGTFPNVIVQHKSLGGSDDLARLHDSGELVKLLETAGVKGGVV